jgi:hypothetical protein
MELGNFLRKQFSLILIVSAALAFILSGVLGGGVDTFISVFGIVMLALTISVCVTANDLMGGKFIQYIFGQYGQTPIEDDENELPTDTFTKTQAKDEYYFYPYVNQHSIVLKCTVFPDGSFKRSYNFHNLEGEYISEKWYSDVMDFNEDGVAIVMDGTMYNFINSKGEIVSTQWFYGIVPFSQGIAKVRWNDGTVNYVKADGKLLWKDWKKDNPGVLELLSDAAEIEKQVV